MAQQGSINGLLIPVSVGELIDKITILEIKIERMASPAQLANVRAELAALKRAEREAAIDRAALAAPVAELKSVNLKLWDIEDAVRDCEARGEFGARFVALARSIYRLNDERSRLKKLINVTTGSALVEEKSYKGT